MTSKKILIALGLVAAFASPSLADTEHQDPVANGRQIIVAIDTANAYAMARPTTKTTQSVRHDRRFVEWLLNERNVGRAP